MIFTSVIQTNWRYVLYSPCNVLPSHLSMRSPCANRVFTCAFRSVRAHTSQSDHIALPIRSAFTYCSIRVHSFSFGTSKSLQATQKKNPCVKVESYFTHQKHHFYQNLIHITKVHILVKVGNYMYKIWRFFLKKTFWLK